jgi:hypothetical protein
MLANFAQLHNPRPRSLPATVERVGNRIAAIDEYGGVTTVIGGRFEFFRSVEDLNEFAQLYDAGKHDRARPFRYPGVSLVVYGSLVCRAPQWVQAEAEDQGVGVWNYVWYFTFARGDGETAHIVAERYDDAMIELAELIRIDGTDDSVMPF